MTLVRSAAGLANQHLFFAVEAMVYVEGGEALSVEEVLTGGGGEHSMDVLYWRGVFGIKFPSKRLRFRAVGSKTTLLAIVERLEGTPIETVFVAMDRDHDEWRGKLVKNRQVLYSAGYSWENDVGQESIMLSCVKMLCHCDLDEEELSAAVSALWDLFRRRLYWLAYADTLLSLAGSSILPRRGVGRLIRETVAGPQIGREFLVSDLRSRERPGRPLRLPNGARFSIRRNCVGHVLNAFYVAGVRFLVRRFAPKSGALTNHVINALSIELCIRSLAGGALPNVRDGLSIGQ